MTLNELLDQIRNRPEQVEFQIVMDVITDNYHFTPVRFTNGQGSLQQVNEPGTNEGSCKIFAFGRIHGLNQDQTLACFGHFYRDDVLKDPTGQGYGNIRAFMVSGWEGVVFDGTVLIEK